LILRSKITQAVLSYFFLQEDKAMYVNEIARRLNLNRGNLVRKLKELEVEGILRSKWQGNQLYYSLNSEFPLIKEYKNIICKTVGLEHILRERLKGLSEIKKVFIFGSYADDKMDISSDIDLLVVGDQDTIELHKMIAQVQKITDRAINTVSMSLEEFEKKKITEPFLKNIFKQKIIKIL